MNYLKRFEKIYKRYIRKKLIYICKKEQINKTLFCEWIAEDLLVYVGFCSVNAMLPTKKRDKSYTLFLNYYSLIEKNDFTKNIKRYSDKYEKYAFINITQFPKDIKEILLSHGVSQGKKSMRTTLQRVIAALKYDITGVEVHHIDFNSINNELSNLLPIEAKEHDKLFHFDNTRKKAERTPEHIIKGKELKTVFDAKLKKDTETKVSKYSKFDDKKLICSILEYKYINKLSYDATHKKITDKTIKNKRPGLQTVKNIIRKFKDYENCLKYIHSKVFD